MEKSKIIFQEVDKLYREATTNMGKWMWRNHTQWVAERSQKLAEKYGADVEKVYCAALLHDLGDAKYERGHADFETWSWEKGKEVLKNVGFRKHERDEILEAVRTHSCHPGHLPATVEGKVLATADALWHLQTNFFPVILYMHRPESTHTYEEWQDWFATKIERDFNAKIFFEDEKTAVKGEYESLIKVFGNQTLDTKHGA